MGKQYKPGLRSDLTKKRFQWNETIVCFCSIFYDAASTYTHWPLSIQTSSIWSSSCLLLAVIINNTDVVQFSCSCWKLTLSDDTRGWMACDKRCIYLYKQLSRGHQTPETRHDVRMFAISLSNHWSMEASRIKQERKATTGSGTQDYGGRESRSEGTVLKSG